MEKRQNHSAARRGKGFRMTSSLLQARIRKVGESRGFAVSRLLTHWAEIVGDDTARVARPVDVRYGRGALGATLTILVSGANAPMVEMSREAIRARVNACYGHAAITRIRLTQTAPAGFADSAAAFGPAPASTVPDPVARQRAEAAAAPVADPGLRAALAGLGAHVLAPRPATR